MILSPDRAPPAVPPYSNSYPSWARSLLHREAGGRCAWCRSEVWFRLAAVDHDHVTGEVRGILCERCNLEDALAGRPSRNEVVGAESVPEDAEVSHYSAEHGVWWGKLGVCSCPTSPASLCCIRFPRREDGE